MFKILAVGIPIGVTILDCFGYVAKVEGISMQPALNPDVNASSDFVFLSRWHSKSFCYNRGEIVCVISPKDPSQKIIKRVIALEGDLIYTERFSKRYCRVPPGHCWVEGDNAGHSLDSNLLGPISVALITAKASHIVWPPSRWSKLRTEIPKGRLPLNIRPGSEHLKAPENLSELMDEDL